MVQVKEIFQVTLTEEQSTQITLYTIAIAMTYLIFCAISLLQKTIESSLHEVANANYKKSENLTKEVMQAVEAKEVFVSSLSHEVRNPLNSLNGSIDYLLNVVKNSDHLKVLKNAKLSSEILLNLVSNVLDAAKLKSDKMEVSYSEAKLEEIIKKVFVINSENLKHSHIQAQALIDRKIPKSIWIDSSRLLQIMMNLVSNAIKFTPRGGNIFVQATWLKEIDEDETLLTTLDDSKFDQLDDLEYKNSENFSPGSRGDSRHLSHKGFFRPCPYEEFSFEEAETRNKNLRSIRVLKPKGLKDVKPHVQSQSFIEPWTIYKTQAIPRTMPTEFRRRTGGPSMTWSPSNPTKKTESGYLKIQVSDTGCGISEDDIPKLFAMFAQAKHNASRSKVGGTGLGLWICKQLCQKMNGDITVYSQVNKGTQFVLYIPVNNDKITRSLSAEIATRSDKVRALIVDDYDFNRDLHKLLLEREGVEVQLACSGVEALEKFMGKSEGYFDFVLMDINMPEMDGFTAAKRIRELESLRQKKTNIYFLSGDYYNEDEVIAGFRASGGASSAQGIRCLRKPIEVEVIKSIVENYSQSGTSEEVLSQKPSFAERKNSFKKRSTESTDSRRKMSHN